MALAMLGLPMVFLSWFLFRWLFASGELDRQQDRKGLHAHLKASRKKIARKERSNARYVYNKWMWFGSGFYGLAGLWTFAVIEISQFVGFLLDFASWPDLLRDGWISFLIAVLMNQLVNLLQALLWFAWWPGDSSLLWLLVAYLAYWLGIDLAKRGVELPTPPG